MNSAPRDREPQPPLPPDGAELADLGVDVRLETLVGRILFIGVVVSSAAVLAGLLLLGRQGVPSGAGSFTRLWSTLLAGRGWAVGEAGLLVLIVTPVLRVIASVTGFARTREWPMVLATAWVLLMLILGFALGGRI